MARGSIAFSWCDGCTTPYSHEDAIQFFRDCPDCGRWLCRECFSGPHKCQQCLANESEYIEDLNKVGKHEG